MLPCVCSVIDHRWCQNAIGTKKWHMRHSWVWHWCSYHVLWSITEQTHGNMESSCFIQSITWKNVSRIWLSFLNFPEFALLSSITFNTTKLINKFHSGQCPRQATTKLILYLFRSAINFNLRQLIYKPFGMIVDDHQCHLWLYQGRTTLN